jgi:hypothetical protein
MRRAFSKLRCAGSTLSELMVALAIATGLSAGMVVGAVTIQKSFIASRHYVNGQAQQLRLLDYMNLDLRRALTVNCTGGQLTLTIPDYYNGLGVPNDPIISNGKVSYGTGTTRISYAKSGSTISRNVNGVLTTLATDVNDFDIALQDSGQVIGISVTFVPRYRRDLNQTASDQVRLGTASYTSTLLRNKRVN